MICQMDKEVYFFKMAIILKYILLLQGEWQLNKRNGYGKIKFANGNLYEVL